MNCKKDNKYDFMFLKIKPFCFSRLMGKVFIPIFIIYIYIYINNVEIPTIKKPFPRHKLHSINYNKKTNYWHEKESIMSLAPLLREVWLINFLNCKKSDNTHGCANTKNKNFSWKKTVIASNKVATKKYLKVICIFWKKVKFAKETVYCDLLSQKNRELSLIIILFSKRGH